MEKDELAKHDHTKNVRFTPRLVELIEMKATEKNTTFSEIVRIACMDYLNNEISDAQLIYASLNDNKQKLRFLENKTELLAVFIMEMARRMIKTLTNRQNVSDEVAELEFQKFLDDSSLSLKKQHGGLLEAMVLDIYQKSGEEN